MNQYGSLGPIWMNMLIDWNKWVAIDSLLHFAIPVSVLWVRLQENE